MATDTEEPLAELQLARHRDLVGRRWGPWVVRAIVVVLATFVALAAANQFGQGPSTSTASAGEASLRVSTPSRLRGGLIFQTRVEIRAVRDIRRPTVVFGGGWFDGITLNSYQPPATSQAPRGSAVTFAYPPLRAGRRMTVYLEWSVNPTNLAWSRALPIALDDGTAPLVGMTRHVTVFP